MPDEYALIMSASQGLGRAFAWFMALLPKGLAVWLVSMAVRKAL